MKIQKIGSLIEKFVLSFWGRIVGVIFLMACIMIISNPLLNATLTTKIIFGSLGGLFVLTLTIQGVIADRRNKFETKKRNSSKVIMSEDIIPEDTNTSKGIYEIINWKVIPKEDNKE